MNYIHSGDLGDIIYFLPVMKYRPGHLFIKADYCTRQYLTPDKYQPLVSLLLHQDYVYSVREWKGEDGLDANKYRWAGATPIGYKDDCLIYNMGKNLAEEQLNFLSIPLSILDEPWLTVPSNRVASCVVNRSARYHGRFPVEYVANDAVFIGMVDEHQQFCDEVKPIPHYPTVDLMEAAKVINGADIFVGNRSCCHALAVGLGKKIVLEMCWDNPNCIFHNREQILSYYEDGKPVAITSKKFYESIGGHPKR